MRWGGWLRSCLLTLHALLVSRASQPNAPALHAAAYGGDAPAQSMRLRPALLKCLRGGCSATAWGSAEGDDSTSEDSEDVRARELLSGTREESDLIVQLWAAILPRMQKNVRALHKAAGKTLDHATAGARALLRTLADQHALAEELDAAAGELERAGSGPAAAAARERAESAECELVCTIVASFGQLMVLLRRVRALRDALELSERLASNGMMDELEQHVSSLAENEKARRTPAAERSARERTLLWLQTDLQLSQMDVSGARETANAASIPLPPNIDLFETAAAAFRALQSRDVRPMLRWLWEQWGDLSPENLRSAAALATQAHLQQVLERARAGNDAEARAVLSAWMASKLPSRSTAAEREGHGAAEGEEEEVWEREGEGAQRTGAGEAEWGNEVSAAQRLAIRAIALGPGTADPTVKRLFALSRWEMVEQAFKMLAYAHLSGPGASRVPLASVLLAAGLTGLKTWDQRPGHRGKDCIPEVCSIFGGCNPEALPPGVEESRTRSSGVAGKPAGGLAWFKKSLYNIARRLPMTVPAETTLLCSYSGKLLDGDDPPCALPNGRIVARSLVMRLADEYYGHNLSLAAWLDLDSVIGDYDVRAPPHPDFKICQVLVS